jgi:hypothetical protein
MSMNEMLADLFARSREELFLPEFRTDTRQLEADEIAILEASGCNSSDWTRVRITERTALDRIRSSDFDGDICIDLPGETFDTPLGRRESLISRVRLRDVSVCGSACLTGTAKIAGYRIHEGVLIEDAGSIIFRPGTFFGSGTRLNLGLETGERSAGSFPCITVELASLLSDGATRDNLLPVYGNFLDSFTSSLAERKQGDICRGACIRAVPVIEDSWIGDSALLDNCLSVRNSTLLGERDSQVRVTDGALVRNSILQWGARVDSMAIIENSVVCEAATVERQGKLLASLLGPDSILSNGEMTASLAGPLTAMHHQSLLIAARWSGGRGNIGYGANIGSNHTSRMPDQEILCGEGIFFGLDCSVKFPADFSRAPYSIFATGVTTLPQRIVFPFSLICAPQSVPAEIPDSWNQIIPGWVLSDNLYALLRNEGKYNARKKARRTDLDSHVLRADTVSLMIAAKALLSDASGCAFYTDADIPGLGMNFLTDSHRLDAMETYGRFIRFWALCRLLERVEGDSSHLSPGGLPPDNGDEDWTLAREVLNGEFTDVSVHELFGILPYLAEAQLESLRISRKKDEARGVRIIPDYDLVHRSLDEDAVVREMKETFTRTISRTHSALEKFRGS